MRATSRLTLAAATLGASALLGAPAAIAQEVCEYPFDCETEGEVITGGDKAPAQPATGGTTASGTSLPVTGGETVLLSLVGAGAIGAGALLVASGRRRGARV